MAFNYNTLTITPKTMRTLVSKKLIKPSQVRDIKGNNPFTNFDLDFMDGKGWNELAMLIVVRDPPYAIRGGIPFRYEMVFRNGASCSAPHDYPPPRLSKDFVKVDNDR